MTFEQLGGKKAECVEPDNKGEEEKSAQNEAYTAAKESFRSPTLGLESFLLIQKTIVEFKKQWKRENLYS